MASGDVLGIFLPTDGLPPAANYATLNTRNTHMVLDFDASTAETIYFESVLDRKYNGGGLTVEVFWIAASATTGGVSWTVAFERQAAGVLDLDGDSIATGTLGASTTDGVSGAITKTSIAFADGTAMDSLAAGECYRMSVVRTVADASDTMTGDAEIVRVVVRET